MQPHAVFWSPSSPFLRKLSDGGVRAAWNIAKYAIKFKSLRFLLIQRLTGWKIGVVLSFMVNDYDIGSAQSIDLVSQQVCSLGICVVGHHEASWRLQVSILVMVEMIAHEELQGLSSLATRSSAHVEDRVVRLDATQ